MKSISANLKGNYKEIILGPIFKLAEAILELIVPLVMADIIDVGIRSGETGYVFRQGVILLALAVTGVIFAMICQYYAAVSAGRLGQKLRTQLYSHVMRLSGSETGGYDAGQLITLVTNDAYQIQYGLNQLIRLGSRVPFLAIGSIIMAMAINFKIGLIFLISTPLVAVVMYLIMRRTLPEYEHIQSGQDDLSRLGRENLDGARVIRAFHRQEAERKAFDDASEGLTGLIIRAGKLSSLMAPLVIFIINIAIIAIVWLGAEFTFVGTSRPGEIIALISYMHTTALALTVAVNLVIAFTRAIASVRRVEALLSIEPAVSDGQGAEPVPGAPALEFDSVSFSYHKGAQNALEDISFTLENGKSLGVIGGTASGKTTLANLIIRAFDCDSGVVNVGGTNVQNYTLQRLRQQIGFAPQKTSLFTGSVKHNLQMAKPGASEGEMWEALSIAQGESFVSEMPAGLDSAVGEGGKNLSGGQRQRLTIARAILRKPDILILDDAASALDYATDAALRSALSEKVRYAAIVIISQRAVSVKNADSILVLDNGRAVGLGSHKELLKSCKVYREICLSQGLDGRQVG